MLKFLYFIWFVMLFIWWENGEGYWFWFGRNLLFCKLVVGVKILLKFMVFFLGNLLFGEDCRYIWCRFCWLRYWFCFSLLFVLCGNGLLNVMEGCCLNCIWKFCLVCLLGGVGGFCSKLMVLWIGWDLVLDFFWLLGFFFVFFGLLFKVMLIILGFCFDFLYYVRNLWNLLVNWVIVMVFL